MGNIELKTETTNRTPQTKGVVFSYSRTAQAIREREGSPHVLDLKPEVGKSKIQKAGKPNRKLPRGWRLVLDQRIHLKDMRYRTVSIRPRGWRDIPSPQAKTLWDAVRIATTQFFTESPLAELTIISLLQTIMVMFWKLLTVPVDQYGKPVTAAPRPKQIKTGLPVLPLMPAPTSTDASRTGISLRNLNPSKWRQSFAYAAIVLALVLPVGAYNAFNALMATKDQVIDRGLAAANYLRVAGAAAQAQDFSGAESSFAMAKEEFGGVKEDLGALASVLTAAGSIAPSTTVSTAGLMLLAGESLAEGGKHVSAGLAELETDVPPADRLRGLNTKITRALPHLQKAANAVSMLSAEALPEEYRATIDMAKVELPRLVTTIEEASNIAGFLALMLGSEEPRRYLLVFQNNSELRPTGGFIGSFALLDVDRGEIKNLEIPGGGSYDLQGQMTAKIAAPKPLRLVSPDWYFHDANWSPDFPTSARRLSWFYEKSGGPTVDGVIAINASVMERLLDVIGPIEMAKYDVTLDAENFVAETQREVELDYDREENKPKQILADMAPKILTRVMDADRDSYIDLARALGAALSAKEIQLWFRNAEMQNQAIDLGWTGQMLPASGDYLQVVHTNIAGQKTDRMMHERITHDVKVLADGSAIVTLKIKRTHNGMPGESLVGVRNVDYLRVYVPLGSQLVEAEGFEIPDPKLFQLPDPEYTPDPIIALQEQREILDRRSGTRTFVENGKTVFANWVQTDPSESSEVKLIYQLPLEAIKLKKPDGGALASAYARITNGVEYHRIAYSLLVQKQSGSNPIEFISSIDMPRGYHVAWESPAYDTDDRGREVTRFTFEEDQLLGLIAESPIRFD